MLASQRQNHILTRLRADGAVRITELAPDLAVSDVTIRRDLGELEAQDFLLRVYGGAVLSAQRGTFSRERPTGPDHVPRTLRSIVAVAEQFITPGTSIALGEGMISTLLAQRIAANPDLRPLIAVTNSPSSALVLAQGPQPQVQIVRTGGSCVPAALAPRVAHAGTTATLTALAFIEVAAVSSSRGLEAASPEAAEANRALLDAAARTIVLLSCTSGEHGPGLTTFASVKSVDAIVTDAHPPELDEDRQVAELIMTDVSCRRQRRGAAADPAIRIADEFGPVRRFAR